MSDQDHPEAIQQKLLHLFKTHEKELKEDVLINARMVDWITLHGYLQLALRHPETTGPTRHFIEEVCVRIEQAALMKGVLDTEIIEYLRRDQADVEATMRERMREAKAKAKKRGR
jgi:hypothetical protein